MAKLSKYVLFMLLLAVGTRGQEAPKQLPNLAEGPKVKPRFEVTDRTWPAEAGAAEVCLWRDDKLAAVSLNVDDNCAPDVDWWLEVAEKYDFPVTWFLITRNVGKSFGGSWELWQRVLDKGHDIQSHTHTHLHVDEPDWQDIDWEYRESKRLIEEKLPGHRALFMAYPGGKHSKHNDREVAAKYYAAVRYVSSSIPKVNEIDYLGVRCGQTAALDNPKIPWADARKLFDPKHRAYRSWCNVVYHLVKEPAKAEPFFEFLKAEKDQLWAGLFGDVARYAQERDTATLTSVANKAEGVILELSDDMDDELFDVPLTIKLRLYDAWQDVVATQADKPVELRVVEHEGARYALVAAVPDRGTIRIAPKP